MPLAQIFLFFFLTHSLFQPLRAAEIAPIETAVELPNLLAREIFFPNYEISDTFVGCSSNGKNKVLVCYSQTAYLYNLIEHSNFSKLDWQVGYDAPYSFTFTDCSINHVNTVSLYATSKIEEEKMYISSYTNVADLIHVPLHTKNNKKERNDPLDSLSDTTRVVNVGELSDEADTLEQVNFYQINPHHTLVHTQKNGIFLARVSSLKEMISLLSPCIQKGLCELIQQKDITDPLQQFFFESTIPEKLQQALIKSGTVVILKETAV